MTALCIPDEADRWRDGWHVVWSGECPDRLMRNKPEVVWWSAETQDWSIYKGGVHRHPPERWTALGYRYGGPAPEAKEAKP